MIIFLNFLVTFSSRYICLQKQILETEGKQGEFQSRTTRRPFLKEWCFSVLPVPLPFASQESSMVVWDIAVFKFQLSIEGPLEGFCYFVFFPKPALLHIVFTLFKIHVNPTNWKVFVHSEAFASLYLTYDFRNSHLVT